MKPGPRKMRKGAIFLNVEAIFQDDESQAGSGSLLPSFRRIEKAEKEMEKGKGESCESTSLNMQNANSSLAIYHFIFIPSKY